MVDNPAFHADDRSYKTFESEEKPEGNEVRQRKTSKEETQSVKKDIVTLQQNIGFLSCVGILVGTIIGSGIFISPKGVLKGTGSIGLTLIMWIVCGFFSFMGAISFAELGTLIPLSGGTYIFILEGLAPNRKKEKLFWGPLLPFLYNWQVQIFAKPAGTAVQMMSISSYLMKINSLGCVKIDDESYETRIRLVAIFIMTTITVINCFSVKLSTTVINMFTVAKLTALIFVIVGGIVTLIQGETKALSTGFEDTTLSIKGISTAIYSGLWAYAGWDNITNVSKEVKRPDKNIVRSMMASLTIVTVVYLLTNISYFIVLSKAEFLESNAVVVDVGSKLVGYFGGVLMILSVASSITGSSIAGSFVFIRISYAAALEGHNFDFLSFLNVKYMTPLVALIMAHCLTMIMIFNSDILSLIYLTGFADSIFFSLSLVSLLIMRKTRKTAERPIKAPIYAPVLALAFSLFLVIAPFLDNPSMEYFYLLLLLLVGVIVYVIFVYYECRVPGFGKVRKIIQILFNVVPPEESDL